MAEKKYLKFVDKSDDKLKEFFLDFVITDRKVMHDLAMNILKQLDPCLEHEKREITFEIKAMVVD